MTRTDSADSTADVVVIGSGAGGLVAALTAARRGLSVVVLEAAKAVGGLLNPFKRGAHRFDTGLHYLGACDAPDREKGLFRELLDALEVSVSLRELDPDGFDRIVMPGYEVRMPRGADAYRDRLARDFPRERDGLDRVFATLAELSRALPRRLDGLGELTAPIALSLTRETYRSFLERHLREPLLRAVLAAQAGNYALPPSRASAFAGLSILEHYASGAFYPKGGSGALRDALVTALRAHGGRVHTGVSAQKILVSGGRARAVTSAETTWTARRGVIANTDVVTTFLELLPASAVPERVRERFLRAEHSLGSVSLFLGASDRGDLFDRYSITDANEWHFDDRDGESPFEAALEGRADIRSVFFSSPSRKDGDHTSATFTALATAPFRPFEAWASDRAMRRGPGYDALKTALGQELLERVERRVPGLVSSCDVIEVSTPLTAMSFVGARLGGSYGLAHTTTQSGLARGRTRTAVPGLLLAGASVFGAGVVWSALSGYAAGALV